MFDLAAGVLFFIFCNVVTVRNRTVKSTQVERTRIFGGLLSVLCFGRLLMKFLANFFKLAFLCLLFH